MANKIGRFEIISQISQSFSSRIYKALDPEGGQTVALKVVALERVPDREALIKRVFEEADQAKPLNSPNISSLYGVGDDGDLLLAASEYVQGNSIATMLARKEGFSIWDIQDIARQLCHALEHAQVHKVMHQALEPAKVMVQWDGTVKVLGFGISTMTSSTQDSCSICELQYCASPEQLCGQTCDARSAIFTLGAILYEMATEQKAFPGATSEEVRAAIAEKPPVQPARLKPNLNPVLNQLIMKALAKSPDQRYGSAEELVRDLEQCKSGGARTAAAAAASSATIQPEQQFAASWQRSKAPVASSQASFAPTTVSARVSKARAAAPLSTPKETSTFAVDPLVAERGGSTPQPNKTFSDIDELPPLKQVTLSAAEVAPVEAEIVQGASIAEFKKAGEEKPTIEVRELAEKALAEIRKTPPKLYVFAIAGAVAVIVLIVGTMALHNFYEERREQGAPASAVQALTGAEQDTGASAKAQPSPASRVDSAPPSATETIAPAAGGQTPPSPRKQSAPEAAKEQPSLSTAERTKKAKLRASAASSAWAQVSVDSTPAGAQIVFDGAALCQSPCRLTDIAPGQHTMSASRAGFAAVTRNLSLGRGERATISVELHPLAGIVSVASTPAGAAIVIDGTDTGKLTPSQISVSAAGAHTVTLRRYGYLEASDPIHVELGQTATVNLTLTHLGNTEEIRAANGKFKKMFGREDNSGMGIVSVKTQPKGAQIMVNDRLLEKSSPFDFYLNPGTYVIDISMAGYQTVHRVIKLQEGEKLAIQETLPVQ
ncbi:MAG: PEGA domain-containing protein [Acidobacteria bacterium]|nr:PEGA domain-containing protein [Acidobacteriota bacterium]